MKIIYIYVLKDPITNQIRYVGKTINIDKRLQGHLNQCNGRKYHSARWIKSLLNNGVKPILEIIEECNEINWVEREKYWIDFYRKTYGLTNILDGGEGGCERGRLGKPWTEKQRENNRKARLGVTINHTKQGRLNITKGYNAYYDKIKKPILQYNLNGEFIKEWSSVVDASKELKTSKANINKVLKTFQLTAKNFMWRFKTDEIQLKINPYIKSESTSNVSICQLTKCGEKINEYKSISEASKETNILRSSISNCLINRSKIAGGFIWVYKK